MNEEKLLKEINKRMEYADEMRKEDNAYWDGVYYALSDTKNLIN